MKNYDMGKIGKKYSIDVSRVKFSIDGDIGHITGEVDDWQQVVKLGKKTLKAFKLRNIINDVTVPGHQIKINTDKEILEEAKKKGVIADYDVVIIGAGISGCAIARELSKYKFRTAVIEKEADVSDGATKSNNGMIHPGNAAIPGTLKAKLNVKGNAMYTQYAKELDFKLKRYGSFAYYEKGANKLLVFLAWLGAKLNKVPDSKFLVGKQIYKYIPDIPGNPKFGVWTGTAGFVDGFEVCIAAAENAAQNGVKFHLKHKVLGIEKDGNKIKSVITDQGIINTKVVINAAGIYADYIAEFAGDRFYTIHPRKGVIAILDKNSKGSNVSLSAVGKAGGRNKNSKGGGGERTVAGNLLFGPSAREVEDREDLSVNKEDFDYAHTVGSIPYPDGTRDKVIAYFAGLRAADYTEDFIIEESKKVDGFIHCSGIQSPGLASAPAIAEYVKDILLKYFNKKNFKVEKNENFNPIRKAAPIFNELPLEEKEKLIKKDPRYGTVVCRCETITEGEIVEALHRPIPCTTIDGIKRRVRASAGRCQGGFCGPKIVEIMARELNIPPLEVSQKGHDRVLIARTRDCEEGVKNA